MTVLALFASGFFALLVVLLVAQARQHARELTDLRGAHERERAQWTRERQTLLNRIKPETAQNVLDPGVPIVPSVRWDDDEDWWSTQEVTKEQLAEALAAREVSDGD